MSSFTNKALVIILMVALLPALACRPSPSRTNSGEVTSDQSSDQTPAPTQPPPTPPSTPTQMGGADPSGGEGQRSSIADLQSIVNQSLDQLEPLFWRMGAFLNSSEPIDQKIVESIAFLKPCFVDKNCTAQLFTTIAKIRETFLREPYYVAGDCPSKTSHLITDMSLSEDLKLCVSQRLTRYPPRELQRQTLSLLAHQVAHALLFTEDPATTVQYWVLENPGIAFPSSSMSKQLLDRDDKFSLQFHFFVRLLGERGNLEQQPICQSAVQLVLSFEDLHMVYSSLDEDSNLVVPQASVRSLSESIYKQIEDIIQEQCIDKRLTVQPNPLDSLFPLVTIASDLEQLRLNFSAFMRGTPGETAFPLTPHPKSLMAALVALHDRAFPHDFAGEISCSLNGLTTVIGRGEPDEEGHAFPVAQLLPPELRDLAPELKIFAANLNQDGGVGLYLRSYPKSDPAKGRSDQNQQDTKLEVKILRTNADIVRGEGHESMRLGIFKVLGNNQNFYSTLRLERVSKDAKQMVGPELKLKCWFR